MTLGTVPIFGASALANMIGAERPSDRRSLMANGRRPAADVIHCKKAYAQNSS